MIQVGDIIEEDDLLSKIDSPPYNSWLQSIDAILLLGGGVPLSPTEPPLYVQRRCDVVAQLMQRMHQHPSVICLSAGTAHVPQYITPHNGLPLWESTASAAYLMRHSKYPVDEHEVYAETTSYDTISNAFFARTTMTDINVGWRRILVVTNEFHIRRSKAIFDWIYHVPASASASSSDSPPPPSYELYYLSCNNVGLSMEALESRKLHEARGERNVKMKLATQYTSLKGVWDFLTEKHDFYNANKLVQRGLGEEDVSKSDNLLKASYGKSSSSSQYANSDYGVGIKIMEYKDDGTIVLSFSVFHVYYVIASLAIIRMCFSLRKQICRARHSKRNPFR